MKDFIYSDEVNGPTYVDLGLSVKWATKNIGAASFSDIGNMYMWGELTSFDYDKYFSCLESQEYINLQTRLIQSNFKDAHPSDLERIQELLGCRTYGIHIKNISANPDYDIACASYGATWHIPTNREWQELIEMCTWTECLQDDFRGAKITSKINGNSIFLPYFKRGQGLSAAYWSSNSLYKAKQRFYNDWRFHSAYALYFDSYIANTEALHPFFIVHIKDKDLPIRPVL